MRRTVSDSWLAARGHDTQAVRAVQDDLPAFNTRSCYRPRACLKPAARDPLSPPSSLQMPYLGRRVDASVLAQAEVAQRRLSTCLEHRHPGVTVQCQLLKPIGYSGSTPIKVGVKHGDGRQEEWFAKVAMGKTKPRLALAREAKWTHWGFASGATPRVIEEDSQAGYLITEMAKGKAVDKSILLTPSCLAQIMAAARRLHRAPPPRMQSIPEAVAFSRPSAEAFELAAKARWLPDTALCALRRYALAIETAIAGLHANPCALHGDLQGGNLLVDDATGRVTLIDYGLACIGDPMDEVGYFAMSVNMPICMAPKLLSLYHSNDLQAHARDLPRLLLRIAHSRLERYVRPSTSSPNDPARMRFLEQQLNDDLDALQHWELLPP